MKAQASVKQAEKVFEIPTVRLSADETRAILSLARTPQGVHVYPNESLLLLGLIQTKRFDTKANDKKKTKLYDRRSACFGRIKTCASIRAVKKILNEINNIEIALHKLNSTRSRREEFVLTALGKQVARGIAVKLSSYR